MKRAIRGWAVVVTAAMSGLVGAGCSSHDGSLTGVVDGDEKGGSLGIELTLASGAVIDTVSYAITGPGGFTKTGTFNVSQSSKIQGLVGGLPAGSGYSVSLSATSVDGGTSCAGSASFKVQAKTTTAVTVAVTCRETSKTGSVLINGNVNVCPLVDGISANPTQVIVGGSMELEALAHDSDASPKALSYAWSATSGSLSSTSSKTPKFTCTAPGIATLSVTVSDGDCGDKGSVDVECTTCAVFDSYMSDLGELTANCRGAIDPRDFSVDRAGNLVPAFEKCTTKASITPILQHLSIQNRLQLSPGARECIGGRFAKALENFKTRGIQTCPSWTLDHVVNPITDAVIEKVVAQLPRPNSDGRLEGEVPQSVIDALKIKHVYNVSFNGPAPSQQCKEASDCATACAEAFPSFVMSPVAGAVGQLLTDTTSWLDTTVFGDQATDRYLRTSFYHTMSYYGGAPGVSFGDYNRFVSCTPTSTDPTCDGSAPESCSYFVGNVGSGFHKKTALQPHCTNWLDVNTCVTYCGPALTGVDAPPAGWTPLPPVTP